MNKNMNMRNCFVTKDSMLTVCGKCGKELLNREWWLKDHANTCHFRKQDLIASFSEEEFAYHFTLVDDGLCLSLYTPRLCRRTDGKKGFSGAEWKRVAEFFFCKDHKEIRELMNESGMSLDEVLRLIDQKEMIGFQSDYMSLIQMVFPLVLKDNGLKNFVDCYRGYGFFKSHPRAEFFQNCLDGTEEGLKVLSATKSINPEYRFRHQSYYDDLVFITQLKEIGYGSEKYLYFKLKWMKKNYHIRYYQNGNRKKKLGIKCHVSDINVIVGDRFFFMDKHIPFDNLAFGLKDLYFERATRSDYRQILKDFDQTYPQYHLMDFMKDGGRNPLLPLIAPFNDTKLELMTKAGLGSITCHLSADHWIFKNPLNFAVSKGGANSFQSLFGLPYKHVKKFKTMDYDRDIYLSFLKAVAADPDLISGKKISKGMVEFLGKNQPDYECQDKIRNFDRYSKEQILRMARFLADKNIAYKDYSFYLNEMGETVEEEGLTPRYFKDICKEIRILERLKNKEINTCLFRKEVSSPSYQKLVTVKNINDKEELKNYKPKYLICAPRTAFEVLAEGIKMHNCVGTYLENIGDGLSKIYFLRETKRPLKSLCTIEVDQHDKLVQLKAFANREASEEIQEFVCAWAWAYNVDYTDCGDITIEREPEELAGKIDCLNRLAA